MLQIARFDSGTCFRPSGVAHDMCPQQNPTSPLGHYLLAMIPLLRSAWIQAVRWEVRYGFSLEESLLYAAIHRQLCHLQGIQA